MNTKLGEGGGFGPTSRNTKKLIFLRLPCVTISLYFINLDGNWEYDAHAFRKIGPYGEKKTDWLLSIQTNVLIRSNNYQMHERTYFWVTIYYMSKK